MRYTFLDKRNDTVVFTGKKLEIFLPKDYFDEEIAEEHGMKISTLGIFAFKYFSNLDSLKHEVYQFDLPETIFFTFSEAYETKEAIKGIEDTYRVFVLYEGDIFIESVQMAKTFKNTEGFVKLHHTARIPSTVEYRSIIGLYMENMLSNNANLRMPSSILEAMIAELARDKNNIDIPFRKSIGSSDKVSELDYIQVSIKKLAMINSTFTAITSENINEAITTSVTKSRTGGLETETPIEPTIKY